MEQEIRTDIIEKFRELGIEDDLARVYLYLLDNGSQSVVSISKHLQFGRNKIYRVLDQLIEKNLVNKIEKQNGSSYEALDFNNLQLIVDRRKSEYQKAESGLNDLLGILPHLKAANSVSSKVVHFTGLDGLKQVNWNLVHAKEIYRVYEVSRLSSYLDDDFAETLRSEWLRRKIYTRDITNDIVIDEHTNISEFTTIYSEYRYIDPKVLKIETEIYIYNDVVTVLQYDNMKYDPNSIFCVEIRNEALAKFQAQIYDILWEQARVLELVNDKGRRVLKE